MRTDDNGTAGQIEKYANKVVEDKAIRDFDNFVT